MTDPTTTRWDLPADDEEEAKFYTSAADRLIKATSLAGFAAVTFGLAEKDGAPAWASMVLYAASIILVLATGPLLAFWAAQVVRGLSAKRRRSDGTLSRGWYWFSVVLACILTGILAIALSAAVSVSQVSVQQSTSVAESE